MGNSQQTENRMPRWHASIRVASVVRGDEETRKKIEREAMKRDR